MDEIENPCEPLMRKGRNTGQTYMYQGVRVIWEESSLRETNNKTTYCLECAKEIDRQKAKERMNKIRNVRSNDIPQN